MYAMFWTVMKIVVAIALIVRLIEIIVDVLT